MDAKKALQVKREKLVLSRKSAVSTGSTLLNLACTDHPDFGFIKGGYYFLVGDSSSGKTWLSLSCFAEANLNEHFRDYDLYFDDVEGGALMNIGHYFGKAVARRMQPPRRDAKGNPICSDTVESFYYNLEDIIKRGRPFIYVLDSQDALDAASAAKKFAKQKAASESGKEEKGSYGDGKAKYHSEHIRHALHGVRKLRSILLIIGQTRDNLGFGFEPKTRSGGKALRFYANLEIWTSVGKKIKRKIRGQDRSIGVYVFAEVRKNRVTGKIGKDRSATIPIYNDFGIDDVGSCIDFLVLNKHWKKDKESKSIKATELDFSGTRGEVIQYVEKAGLEDQLRQITGTLWREIEEECKLVGRKRRYE